jgi:hypothetical protein
LQNITIFGVDPARFDCSRISVGTNTLPSANCIADEAHNTLLLAFADIPLTTSSITVSVPQKSSPNPPPPPPGPNKPLLHQPLFIWTVTGSACALFLIVMSIVCVRRRCCPDSVQRCCSCCVPADSEAQALLAQQQKEQEARAHVAAGDL